MGIAERLDRSDAVLAADLNPVDEAKAVLLVVLLQGTKNFLIFPFLCKQLAAMPLEVLEIRVIFKFSFIKKIVKNN